MARKTERKGLGRGLSALLAETAAPTDDTAEPTPGPRPDARLPIDKLRPNPDQPRRDFPEIDLEGLAQSIRAKGIIQPLIVRPDPTEQGCFQIVAGERRWRAAQRAQVHEVPVIVRELDDTDVLELAIIENIQRADLNPVEEALAYRQLMDRFGHTQEAMAEELGKSRSHIANLLRLLSLPEPVLQMLRTGRLTAGHARALVTAEDPIRLAQRIVDEGLSVRQTEALMRQISVKPKVKQILKPRKDPDTRAVESDLSAALGLRVSIDHAPGGESGTLRIRYATLDELDGLCQLLSQAE